MSERDHTPGGEPFDDLPQLPRDEGGPVFAEPWQAQAFALAVTLSERGHFTRNEWAAALATELQAAARRGEPDDGSRYYEHWLAALEHLVTAKRLTDPTALLTRKDAWATAYRHTPHGQPVELLPSRTPDASWLLLGLVTTLAAYWMLQQAIPEPLGEGGRWWSWSTLAERSGLPLGFAASAGLGILLGMRHALEPDHLAAVSTLLTGERSSAKTAWLGACWGLGHTLTLFATGAVLVIVQTDMPAIAARIFDGGVLLLLLGFGVRACYQGACGIPSFPTHSHRRRGARQPWHMDRWTIARPLLVGALHGLAGSGAIAALLVTSLPSTATRLSYLLLFGVGSTVGMAALSGLLGWPIARLGSDQGFLRGASLSVGGVSIALGASWAAPVIRGLFNS